MRNPQNGLNFKRGTITIKLVEILHLEQCDRLACEEIATWAVWNL